MSASRRVQRCDMSDKQNHPIDRPDPLRDALKDLPREKPSPEFVEQLRSRMLAKHTAKTSRRRWPWALPVSAGSAVAAMLMLAFVLWPKPAATFGSVQQRMRNISTMSCVAHLVVDDKRVPEDILTITTWADATKGARTEARVLGVPVLSSLVHWGEEGWLINNLRSKAIAVPPNQIVLSRLRELDPTRLVLDLREQEGITAAPLDEQTLDGERARGFRLSGGFLARRPGTQVTIWVSTQTYLPVRLECRLPIAEQGHIDFVVDQFQWDAPLDATLFNPPIVMNAASVADVVSRPNQAILFAGLRDFALHSGGYYPGNPAADQTVIMLVMKLRSAAERGGSWADRNREDVALFEKLVNGGLYLLIQASRGNTPAYDGQNVTAADATHELISWQNDKGVRERYAGNLQMMPD